MTRGMHPDIPNACWRADAILWDAFARGNGIARSDLPRGRLVFPCGSNGPRVSEQEARFAFVDALCRGPLRYSVETPTCKSYGFSGKGKRSAQTDLTVRDEKLAPLCNVEFKSGGSSRGIAKDMEKLAREPLPGLWFHLLEGVDNSTIGGLLDAIATCGRQHFEDIDSASFTVHLCVLRHRFSIQKSFPFPAPENDQFEIEVRVSRSELLEVRRPNGWIVKHLP